MAAVQDAEREPERLLEQAREELHNQGLDGYDEVRFVAYSYPKLAVQFLSSGRELAMLELFSWQPVPEHQDEETENFSRWSYLESLGRNAIKRAARFEAELETTNNLADQLGLPLFRIVLSMAASTCGWRSAAICGSAPGRATTGSASNSATSRLTCGASGPACRCCSTSTATSTARSGSPRNSAWARWPTPTGCSTPTIAWW